MRTTIKDGTIVCYTYRGLPEYAVVGGSGKYITVVSEPANGDLVQRCVWKENGESLEPRGRPFKFDGHINSY